MADDKTVTAVVVGQAPELQGQLGTTIAPTTPNVLIVVLNPIVSLLTRTLRAYLQSLLGVIVAGSMGIAPEHLPAHDFLHLLRFAAGLALAPAILCFLQNSVELLTRLDQSNPALRG
jgi:hypothetical protein